MSDPVFLRHTSGLTLVEIATLIGAVPAAAPHTRRIVNIAPLDRASPSDLTFFDNKKYAATAAATHAGACLTTASLAKHLPAHVAVLTVAEPYRAFVTVARELFPHSLRPSSLAMFGGTAGAHVDPSARLENGVVIDPGAVIGPGAEIGFGTVIGANAVIGAEVRIGRDSSIDFSGVTKTSPFDSRPSLASAPASASAQLSPLRLHEQVGSRLVRYFSALGRSMYFAPAIDTACSIWPEGGYV